MFRLKDRIPYADGSIAKEIVMQNHSGLSLLMAVAKGLEVPHIRLMPTCSSR